MPRRAREDEVGGIHHVYNRALGRRPMFEATEDFRHFQSLLARAVRRGEIQVYAFCLLDTHYHVVLKVVRGSLAATMQWIQTSYSRRFNRKLRRDGPLIRGRYGSRRIHEHAYFLAVLRYVENNAVDAKIVQEAPDYSFGSAARRREKRPPR